MKCRDTASSITSEIVMAILVADVCCSWKGLRKVGSDAGNLIGCCSFCLKSIIDRLIGTLNRHNALATDLDSAVCPSGNKSQLVEEITYRLLGPICATHLTGTNCGHSSGNL